MRKELEGLKSKFEELFEVNNYSVFLYPQKRAVLNNFLELLEDIELSIKNIKIIIRKRERGVDN